MKALLLLLAACGDTATITIVPELELPTDEEADALPELTQIRISIDGTSLDDVFDRGQNIVIDDVPLADNLVLRLDGFTDGQGVAVGRTCPFSLANGNRPSPRIYFSQVVRTGSLAQTSQPRSRGAAVTLADDSVLLVGGDGSSTIERYDPRTAVITEIAGDPFEPRTGAAIAVFDGRPAIIGGLVGGAPASDALLISSTGVVEVVPDTDATVERSNVTATSLVDGDVLITGGRDAAGMASGKIVRLRTDAMTDIIELETVNSAALAHPRERHVVTPLGDGGASLLITGGNDSLGLIAPSELYRTNLDERIALESPKFDLKFPRTGHRAALLPDESVVIIGGVDLAGNPVRVMERFSLINGVVTVSQPLPETAPALDFSLRALPDGTILMVGGRQRAGDPAQANVFLIRLDAATDNVDVGPRDPMSIPRIDPQLAVLCDGTVLISGGTDQPDILERFNPNVRPKL